MKGDNKKNKIEELKEKIAYLERENNALSEHVEETILLNFISESFDSINDDKELLEALLEKVSILKGVPLCYCIEITPRKYNVIGNYCAFDIDEIDSVKPVISKRLIKSLKSDGILRVACQGDDNDEFKVPPVNYFKPNEAVFITFHNHTISNGVFVFVSDFNDDGVFNDLFIFHQFVKIVSDKWERLGLILQLKKLNESLERKVKKRTSELTRLNDLIFKEIQANQNTNLELQIEKEKFRQLFNQANDAIYLWELDDKLNIKKCMEVNQAAQNMTGYSRSDFMKMTPVDLMENGKQSELKAFLQRLEEIKTSKVEVVHQRKDGITFPVEVSSHLFTLNDKKVVLSIARDITEHKKIEKDLIEAKEKAEESDRLKSSFLANMSHEIRTPLNAISGFAELLKEDTLNMLEVKDFAGIILNNSVHLLNLINDLVDFSKLEAGFIKPSLALCNVGELLRNLEANIHSLLYNYKKEHIAVLFDIPDFLFEKAIVTDEVKLRQILSNLLNNSIKFTQKGSVSVSVELLESNNLQFVISDTGIGIPEKFHQKIFERFVQVKDKKTFSIPGTGLGLAICRNLVEMLNGDLRLINSSRKGTSFACTIPYTLA
nr:ATP-binding protein [uncultured Carboxylicivirga sp.]